MNNLEVENQITNDVSIENKTEKFFADKYRESR